MSSDKAREFTITYETNDGWFGYLLATPHDGNQYDSIRYDEKLHVIEMSAYQAAQEEINKLQEERIGLKHDSQAKDHEIEKLKNQIAVLSYKPPSALMEEIEQMKSKLARYEGAILLLRDITQAMGETARQALGGG